MLSRPIILLYASIICGALAQDTTPPVWSNDLSDVLCDVGLLETKGSGAEIGFLEAVDPEGSVVTYGGGSRVFSVDRDSGAVTLALNLDRETEDSYEVSFTASDSAGNTVESSCQMRVIDVNDNYPVFQGTPYTAFVEENAGLDHVVFERISATDRDTGLNGQIEFSCFVPTNSQEAAISCEYFNVETYTSGSGNYMGRVTLKKSLDFETDPGYVMSVKASDKGETVGSSVVTVLIEVTDVQDSPPVFVSKTMSLVVRENEQLGKALSPPIQARDPDTQVPRPLLLEILSDPERLFTLGEAVVIEEQDNLYSVPVLVNGEIDRETLGNKYSFSVMVSEVDDAGQKTDANAVMNISVSIRDQNDHNPEFNKEEYFIVTPEELLTDTDLPGLNMVVTDMDIGNNARYELSIVDDPRSNLGVPMSTVYSVSPQNAVGSTSVVLVVESPQYLNYEIEDYRVQYLQVVATETLTVDQRSSQVPVQITLTDINDNLPQFSVSTYSISVRENSDVGSRLTTITANDVDSGVFGDVTYALIGTGSEKFNVNIQTGEVTLAKSLDFEENPVILLQFQATDGGGLSQSIPFRVNVMGYNDQAPEFTQTQYDAIVLETDIILRPSLKVTAYDKDSEAPITYTIIAGNTPDNAFVIDTNQGNVTLKRPIDYMETPDMSGQFSLLIEASDNARAPQTSTVYAYITIRDQNNHAPTFWRGVYTKKLSELVPKDTFVSHVNASDMDSPKNAGISYLIDSGHKDNFKIDENSGIITTAVPNLDIDKYGDSYNVIVYAVDNGSPQQTGTAEVKITVYDANNQIPKFPSDAYVITVLEGVEVGTNVSQITADDPDTTSNIVYRIQPDSITAKDKNGNPVIDPSIFDFMNAFKLDPTSGEITTALKLNRNLVAQVFFVIEANDTNAEIPEQQIGRTAIQINILPEGTSVYFPPPWTPQNREFVITVNEELPENSLIIHLTATDPLTGTPITHYKKVSGSDPNNYFRVEESTGSIYPNQRLDFEKLGGNNVLRFQVEALTDGPDVRRAEATLTVIVLDINDHSPQFEQNKYQFNPLETNALYPENLPLIGRVHATDEDSGNFSHLTYSLSGNGADVFYIDPITGDIYVRENRSLDREYTTTYRLLVTATDGGDLEPKLKTSVPLDIYIGDVNDNIPEFQQDTYSIYTLENVGAQTSLGQVTAEDGDDDRNGRVDYSIVSPPGTVLDLFSVESSTGIIRTNRNLTGFAQDEAFEVVIQAKDNGDEPQSAEVNVLIYVNDMQAGDNTPRITFPEENHIFDVAEGTNVSTTVVYVDAAPRNPDNENSHLTFSFLENGALNDGTDKFEIDPETGDIRVKDTLDFEGGEQIFRLIIVIRSNDDPPGEVQRLIYINITNINDNDPSFVSCTDFNNPEFAKVKEGEPVSTKVTQVKACDADGDTDIYYFIITGNVINTTSGGEVQHFSIDKRSGVIYTDVVLDREEIDSYELCITATDIATEIPTAERCSRRQKRQISSAREDVLWLTITVEDVDDNGPTFEDQNGRPQQFTEGILATTRFGTNVIQISAGDSDSNPEFSSVTYSLKAEQFIHSTENNVQSTEKAFKIEPSTGVVVTNLKTYIPYIGGYFQMTVLATDTTGRTAEADLFIYIVREFQRLRFIFDSEPDDVKNYYQVFLQQLRQFFSDLQINADSLHFSVLEEGRVNFDKTDLCFHVVTNNKVLNADQALQRFDHKLDSDPSLQELYDRYEMEDIDVCEVKTTTRWWSGHWWLWWLLIALALFILLVSLILICCICYCWPKYKRNSYKEKPYVILDPPVAMSNPEYEWQEDIVKMN